MFCSLRWAALGYGDVYRQSPATHSLQEGLIQVQDISIKLEHCNTVSVM